MVAVLNGADQEQQRVLAVAAFGRVLNTASPVAPTMITVMIRATADTTMCAVSKLFRARRLSRARGASALGSSVECGWHSRS